MIHCNWVLWQAEDVRRFLFLVLNRICRLRCRLIDFGRCCDIFWSRLFYWLIIGVIVMCYWNDCGVAYLLTRLNQYHSRFVGICKDIVCTIIMILMREYIIVLRALALIMHSDNICSLIIQRCIQCVHHLALRLQRINRCKNRSRGFLNFLRWNIDYFTAFSF